MIRRNARVVVSVLILWFVFLCLASVLCAMCGRNENPIEGMTFAPLSTYVPEGTTRDLSTVVLNWDVSTNGASAAGMSPAPQYKFFDKSVEYHDDPSVWQNREGQPFGKTVVWDPRQGKMVEMEFASSREIIGAPIVYDPSGSSLTSTSAIMPFWTSFVPNYAETTALTTLFRK